MRKKRITILLGLILLLTSSVHGQQRTYPFSSAKSLPDRNDPSDFEFSTGEHNYSISSSGRGSRKGGQSPARSFNLRLHRDDRLTHVIYHAEYQGDLLLIGEASDGLYGAGFIVRLDGPTLRIKWKTSLWGFNVGQGLIDDKYAYVTAIGFVGKVNLNSGVYVWRHRDLYRRSNQAFNSFELPEVQGAQVIFREAPSYMRKKVAVIRIDRRSGRIISLDARLSISLESLQVRKADPVPASRLNATQDRRGQGPPS